MADALWRGCRFRTFNVLDDFNRAALTIGIDTSLPPARVVRGACTNFCVNGQWAGNCHIARSDDDRLEENTRFACAPAE